jgi:ribosomal protein S18 acetylase RimI-like enzyme
MTGAAVTVRPFLAADIDEVIAVLRDLQASERELFPRMSAPEAMGADYIHAIRKEAEDAGGNLFVAEVDGKIAGYCTLLTRCDSSDELDEDPYEFAYVGDLGVLAAERSKGIGARLLEECETRARAAGIQWLRLSVLAANTRARRFYAAKGFNEHLIRLEKPL